MALAKYNLHPGEILGLMRHGIEGVRWPAHTGDINKPFRIRPTDFCDIVVGIDDIEGVVG